MSARLAYLASEYPAISHTFIFREVQALRSAGIEVITLSIRRPAHLDRMPEQEKAEASDTIYIKDAPFARVLGAHVATFAASPTGYARMALAALAWAAFGRLSFLKAVAYFAEAGLLISSLRRRGVRHVHVHFGNPAATVALLAARAGALEFSLSIHGPDIFDDVQANLLPEKLAAAVFTRCISHFCRSQVMRWLPATAWASLPIVRCGVDVARYAPRPDPNNTTPELLCVGRLTPAKGQHVLLEACAALRRRGRAFHLTLVGDGPDRASLEARAASLNLNECVTFAGAVGQDAVHAFYDRADIFVLASFAEGLPVVLMEAMAKGIPCVATRIMGIPELIEDGETGLLVPASDEAGLAERLERLCQDRALRERLGKNGRARVLAEYNLEQNGAAMAEAFRTFGVA